MADQGWEQVAAEINAAYLASLTALLRAGARSVGAADISESDSGATCLGAILRRYDEAQAALALSAAARQEPI